MGNCRPRCSISGPAKFVTADRPLLEEVDLTRPGFPVVRSSLAAPEIPDLPPPDLEKAIRQSGIVGDHPSILKALETCALLAPSEVPVLILGETGTGKELFARFIHRLSGRPADRFIPINCGAIPAELVESLLFGHVKGAFTGALRDQAGKFTQADGGTLFLDELGELPLAAQVKLLRVLQDGMVEPLGAGVGRRVDVRLIAATNQDLRRAVREGQFREDLYYRLNVGEIQLPPLRERRSDIPKLALHVLDRLNARLKRPKRLTPGSPVQAAGLCLAGQRPGPGKRPGALRPPDHQRPPGRGRPPDSRTPERRRSPGEPARTPGRLFPGGLSPPDQAAAAAPGPGIVPGQSVRRGPAPGDVAPGGA